MGAGRLSGDIMSTELQYPNLRSLEAWNTFKNATWWSYAVVACLSFYAGFGLVNGRNINVVRKAKVILWLAGPVALIVMGVVIPFAVFEKLEFDPQLVGGFITSVIGAAIWTAYLSKSKRVKATYGLR